MTTTCANVSRSGRLNIPAKFRRAIGLEEGGAVVLELDGGEIRIRAVGEIVARAQELTARLLAGRKKSSVAAFIAERRREVRKK
jgi:AbrB family looped-hinge helix DNA binding protein